MLLALAGQKAGVVRALGKAHPPAHETNPVFCPEEVVVAEGGDHGLVQGRAERLIPDHLAEELKRGHWLVLGNLQDQEWKIQVKLRQSRGAVAGGRNQP